MSHAASLNAVSATTRPDPPAPPGRRGIGRVEHRLDVQQQQRLHRLASIWPAFRPPWPGTRRPVARPRCWRLAQVADVAPALLAIQWPAPAAADAWGAARRHCPAARPCARPTAATRRWPWRPSPACGHRARPRPWRRPPRQPLRPAPRPGRRRGRQAGGHRQQPVVVHRVQAVHLRAAARRLADALREQRMVLAQERADDERAVSCDSDAIDVPSQRALPAPRCCRSRRGGCARRCSRCPGRAPAWPAGAVLRPWRWALPTAPMPATPNSALMRFRPSAT
jgi:hypothetical protein